MSNLLAAACDDIKEDTFSAAEVARVFVMPANAGIQAVGLWAKWGQTVQNVKNAGLQDLTPGFAVVV